MKIPQKLLKRKALIIVVALLLLSTSGYLVYEKAHASAGVNKYVVSEVTKGSVINSIAGSGQVSTSDTIAVKPKVSGDITSINEKTSQEVKKGDVIATINSKDAQKTVRDAQASLQSAQLSLQKLQESVDTLSLLQAQNSLQGARDSLEKLKLTQQTDYQKAQQSKQNAQDDLSKVYEDSFSTISNTFLDLPTVISKLDDVLHGPSISNNEATGSRGQSNISSLINSVGMDEMDNMEAFTISAENDYNSARTKYNKNFTDYKNTNRYSDQATIEALLFETLETTKSMAQAAKSSSDMLNKWVDYRTGHSWTIFKTVTDYQSDLSTCIGQTNSHLSAILAQQQTIKNDKDTMANADNDLKQMDQNNPLDIASAQESIKEKEITLQKLQAGPDSIDLASSQLNVREKQNALYDAQEKLADYTIKAPADGIIASVDARVGDPASSATSIATLISKQKVADVSLSETDITKIKVGQKATFTFDAIDSLTLTGEVAEIGSVGTTTQGVVSYTVKMVFSTDDDRVMSGMSFSVNIITDSKTDVLVVPSGAIKSSGDSSYVLIPDEDIADSQLDILTGITLKNPAKQQVVEAGLTDGTNTEIISGLTEGDKIITKTIKPTTTSASTSSSSSTTRSTTQSLIGGGGAVRIQTGGGRPAD